MERTYLNELDYSRDCNSLFIATNRFIDGSPIVRTPPILFKRGYLGTTARPQCGVYDGYDQMTGGNIRYYSGEMRSPVHHYSKELGRWEDIQPQRYWLMGWNRLMDNDVAWKAAFLDDYSRYLNRYEYQ